MKRNVVTTFALCLSCVAAHAEGGFLGKLKKTVDAVADGASTVNQAQQPENAHAPETKQAQQPENTHAPENEVGLKCRRAANEVRARINAENREANPEELYTLGRGYSYRPDGSPEFYAYMTQSAIPYYEKSARGGNTDALLYLLKFYGLGYNDGLESETANWPRFKEICELKVEKFADYKVPAELPQLANMVETKCKEIKAKEEARLAEEAAQKEEKKQQAAEALAKMQAKEDARLAAEAKQKEEAKRQEDLKIAQKKAMDELLTDTKRKYPKADLFKSNIKIYKDFESGVSYQWTVAKLKKDGIAFEKDTPSPFYGTSLSFQDGNNNVVLAFASETDVSENPEGVLAMASIVLPIGISHDTVLKKYRDQYSGATVKHETEKTAVAIKPTILGNGMVLIPEYATLITKDHISCENGKVDVISQVLVGKAFYAENIVSPKSLFFELLPDGGYEKGENLSPALEQAVPECVANIKTMSMLQMGSVKILLTDVAIARVFTEFKNSAEANAQQKAADEKRKADAAALKF